MNDFLQKLAMKLLETLLVKLLLSILWVAAKYSARKSLYLCLWIAPRRKANLLNAYFTDWAETKKWAEKFEMFVSIYRVALILRWDDIIYRSNLFPRKRRKVTYKFRLANPKISLWRARTQVLLFLVFRANTRKSRRLAS